uniref:Uncharacterized protein n=1 Tax=Sphaerodactylus townsendi TaxID=933632 RepID=A0ACB8G1P3_9SAUR
MENRARAFIPPPETFHRSSAEGTQVVTRQGKKSLLWRQVDKFFFRFFQVMDVQTENWSFQPSTYHLQPQWLKLTAWKLNYLIMGGGGGERERKKERKKKKEREKWGRQLLQQGRLTHDREKSFNLDSVRIGVPWSFEFHVLSEERGKELKRVDVLFPIGGGKSNLVPAPLDNGEYPNMPGVLISMKRRKSHIIVVCGRRGRTGSLLPPILSKPITMDLKLHGPAKVNKLTQTKCKQTIGDAKRSLRAILLKTSSPIIRNYLSTLGAGNKLGKYLDYWMTVGV